MEYLLQSWPWYITGPMISLILFLLYYLGKSFGVSSNLETICALGGAGKFVSFFKFDWRKNSWNLVFLAGAVLGGFISYQWLTPSEVIALNPQTIQDLSALGFENVGATFLPDQIFSRDALLSVKGFFILLVAGLLVGFGARYAGGCTSGHAIVGLSNLELPSLISVIGFFIGGLLMTWILIPILF